MREIGAGLPLGEERDERAIAALALGGPVRRVRSPREQEDALRAQRGYEWAARRRLTTPGPLSDSDRAAGLREWIDLTGVENVVQRYLDTAEGRQGYGRPSERDERGPYAFAALVAIWRGTWPADRWPAVAGPLPQKPNARLLRAAERAARLLVEQVITPDAELRLIWTDEDGTHAALAREVAALAEALGKDG